MGRGNRLAFDIVHGATRFNEEFAISQLPAESVTRPRRHNNCFGQLLLRLQRSRKGATQRGRIRSRKAETTFSV
jgi:hypothetical protein